MKKFVRDYNDYVNGNIGLRSVFLILRSTHQVNVFQLLTTFLKQNFLSLVQRANVFEELVLLVHDFAFSRRRFYCRISDVERGITVPALVLEQGIAGGENVLQFGDSVPEPTGSKGCDGLPAYVNLTPEKGFAKNFRMFLM